MTKPIESKWCVVACLLLSAPMADCKENRFSRSAEAATRSPGTVDSIVILKKDRELMAMRNDSVLARYSIALGKTPEGAKRCEGDNKTPEGRYRVVLKKEHSQFHKALQISYPDSEDRAASKALRCDPGSSIMIHGLKNGMGWLGSFQSAVDWTKGCIALKDDDMDVLFEQSKVGTNVIIRP
ncbi:MAG: L,D-transpeptidase family protein [Fibrobacterota bacterium]|nr:L,D-transpeptidase family protein [Fibrobacterota bacterium]QQS06991.1 MAG: L,D-transpeptidase family protein [Fibrobacterota bacterium]